MNNEGTEVPNAGCAARTNYAHFTASELSMPWSKYSAVQWNLYLCATRSRLDRSVELHTKAFW